MDEILRCGFVQACVPDTAERPCVPLDLTGFVQAQRACKTRLYTVPGSLSRPSPLSGNRRMTNGPDISLGCSPALNGTTRSDTFGSSDTSASRASCPATIAGPPTGRRRMPWLRATCRCRGAVARRMSGWRAIRTWTRRLISSSSTPGLSARIKVRA